LTCVPSSTITKHVDKDRSFPMSTPPATIRALAPEDAADYQTLRLRALRDHPEVFGASLRDEEEQTVEQVAGRLAAKTPEDFILGAYVETGLSGMLGLARREGAKRCHRAIISGMYVAPEQRQSGLGRALLGEAIRSARTLDGLEILLLAVAVGNEPARRLYVSAGFEPHYVDWHALKVDGAYIDLEWMRLVLT
jgi:ribosomal protein S18 acetylase RimI-like enzyme